MGVFIEIAPTTSPGTCLFDPDYRPKPAFDGFIEGLTDSVGHARGARSDRRACRASRAWLTLTRPIRDYRLMTVGTTVRRVAAGEFKAKCLAILDEVDRTGRPVLVTKRGRPVARVLPASEDGPRPLIGSIVFEGDVLSPVDVEWNALKSRR